jgi:hypothetical protein
MQRFTCGDFFTETTQFHGLFVNFFFQIKSGPKLKSFGPYFLVKSSRDFYQSGSSSFDNLIIYKERYIAITAVTLKIEMTLGKLISNNTAGKSVNKGAIDTKPTRFLDPGVTNCFSPQNGHSTPLLNRRNLINVFFQLHLSPQLLQFGISSPPVSTYTFLTTNEFH